MISLEGVSTRSFIAALSLSFCMASFSQAQASQQDLAAQAHATSNNSNEVAIVIHGGAGTISRANLSPEQEAQYRAILKTAVEHGYQQLQAGTAGEDVVVSTLQILEDSPLFNAGVGAVYTFDGEHELDASIMHGANQDAGAVAGVKHLKSPIQAAKLVMRESVHVMLSGQGAEDFAFKHGMQKVDNTIFNTERRFEALQKAKANIQADETAFYADPLNADYKYGTVGAVVLDKQGNLVAGTTTGGMTAKRYGRVGDSPIIGAGTFADNQSCAVSATGHGEYFIRFHVAADICARMKYKGISLDKAADEVINDVLKTKGGDGGIIAIDHHGNVNMTFNTPGMYRASIDASGKTYVGIYHDN